MKTVEEFMKLLRIVTLLAGLCPVAATAMEIPANNDKPIYIPLMQSSNTIETPKVSPLIDIVCNNLFKKFKEKQCTTKELIALYEKINKIPQDLVDYLYVYLFKHETLILEEINNFDPQYIARLSNGNYHIENLIAASNGNIILQALNRDTGNVENLTITLPDSVKLETPTEVNKNTKIEVGIVDGAIRVTVKKVNEPEIIFDTSYDAIDPQQFSCSVRYLDADKPNPHLIQVTCTRKYQLTQQILIGLNTTNIVIPNLESDLFDFLIVIDTQTQTYTIIKQQPVITSDAAHGFYFIKKKLSCLSIPQLNSQEIKCISMPFDLEIKIPEKANPALLIDDTYLFMIDKKGDVYKYITHKALTKNSNLQELLALIILQKQKNNNEVLNRHLFKTLKNSKNERIQEIVKECFSKEPEVVMTAKGSVTIQKEINENEETDKKQRCVIT